MSDAPPHGGAAPLGGTAWRAADAPATAALLALVDDWDELAELEAALDGPGAHGRAGGGPSGIRPEALVTEPFRARPACPVGSTFRPAHGGAGVFYGAASVAGALADLVALRRRFFRHADPSRLPDRHAAVLVFPVPIDAAAAIDLTAEPLSLGARMTARIGPTLVRELRAGGVQAAVYRSGGDDAPVACLAEGPRPVPSAAPPSDSPPEPPPPDRAIAIFSPGTVTPPSPDRVERWSLLLRHDGALAWRDGAPGQRLAFLWDDDTTAV